MDSTTNGKFPDQYGSFWMGTSSVPSSKLTKNPWENHHVSISMAIFNSHVSLPEGNARFFIAMFDYRRVQARYILVLWEYIGERTIINQQNMGTEWK